MKMVDDYLKAFEDYLSLHPFKGEPASLFESAEYMMQLGGKRLRPVMVLMGCDLFAADFREALPAAMAVEVFHNFTLVHDDIMDKAPLRRGRPTMHYRWDEPTAILSGDMMMVKACMFLNELRLPILKEALNIFNETAVDVCKGQHLDMLFEHREEVGISEYLEMISLKTSVLLGCCFYLGALIGGAPSEEALALHRFGKNLGIAFQLQDDILDAFATDPSKFGKQVGGDILSNKKTFLLITALKNANPTQKEQLRHWMSDSMVASDEKVKAVKEIFIATGARKETEAEQLLYYNKALDALSYVSISDDKKMALGAFAESVMHRTK